ncbi:DUF563 domain-containing protein [Phormidium tenue FACHB-886]|nr:DUF563 domain-containing protein [Phormidium tenue FACHB-886]
MQLRLYELHYNLGHLLHQQGNLTDAATSYRQTIALNPDYVNAYHSLGVTMDEQGQPEAAIAYYQQAIALDPAYIKTYNNLGCALAKLDRLEEAVQVYRQAIALQPDWAILHSNLGQALWELDPAAAIAAYQRAIYLQPDLGIAHYNLGKIWQFKGRHAAAIACFEQAIKLDVNALEAMSHCGVSWLALKDWQRALAYFRQAIVPQTALIQAFCAGVAPLKEADELTQARIACGKFLEALQEGGSVPKVVLLTQTLIHLANALVLYGGTAQYRQAERYYQQALLLQPANLELQLRLIDCLIHQQRFNAATLACHAAIAQHSQQSQLWARLGYLQERQQQWATAIGYYRQALQGWSQPAERGGPTQEGNSLALAALRQRNTLNEPVCKGWLTVQAWLEEVSTPENGSVSAAADCSIAPAATMPSVAPACDGLNCTPCLKRIFRQFNLTHLGQDRYTCTSFPEFPALPRFAAVIPDGKAWAMAQQNSWQVCGAIAILTPDNRLLMDVSRDYPGQLPGCQQHDPANHRIFSEALPAPAQIAGTVAAVAGLSGHNYFHWMVDVLPRLEILRRSGVSWDEIDWVWINGGQQAFQQETLRAIGVPQAKVLSSDRHPYIQARLLVPSFAGHLGWLEPWALHFLRETFLPLAQPPSNIQSDRLYISRASAQHRRVLNEAALIEQLQPLGFVSVELEKLSFAEQVGLFAQAKTIVAPHGGGLTNLLFCQPETVVVEMASPHYLRHYYWAISQPLRLQHFLLTGEAVACEPIRRLMYPSPLTEDIWIDVDALKALVLANDV